MSRSNGRAAFAEVAATNVHEVGNSPRFGMPASVRSRVLPVRNTRWLRARCRLVHMRYLCAFPPQPRLDVMCEDMLPLFELCAFGLPLPFRNLSQT